MMQMSYEVDWELEFSAFKKSVRELVREAQRKDTVLPIPFSTGGSLPFANAILSQINCESCDALCCKSNPNGEPIGLIKGEYLRLADKFGEEKLKSLGIKMDGEVGTIPMPCPFLLGNDKCSIYSDRPLICVLYPLDAGGSDGAGNQLLALGSVCPEARRIIKDIYLHWWRLRKQVARSGLMSMSNELINEILERRGICLKK